MLQNVFIDTKKTNESTAQSTDVQQPSVDHSSHVGEHGYFSDDDDEEDDDDYVPPEPWKKQIRIGDDYQAVIPDFYYRIETAAPSSPNSKTDCLLWRLPDHLSMEQGLFGINAVL